MLPRTYELLTSEPLLFVLLVWQDALYGWGVRGCDRN